MLSYLTGSLREIYKAKKTIPVYSDLNGNRHMVGSLEVGDEYTVLGSVPSPYIKTDKYPGMNPRGFLIKIQPGIYRDIPANLVPPGYIIAELKGDVSSYQYAAHTSERDMKLRPAVPSVPPPGYIEPPHVEPVKIEKKRSFNLITLIILVILLIFLTSDK